MIERNRNLAGKSYNMLFGLCNIADGLVRIFSFGQFHTNLPIRVSRYQAKIQSNKVRGV